MNRTRAVASQLELPPEELLFSADLVADQPEPVRRFFTHSIAPGTPLARSVQLKQTGSMQPRPGAARFDLTATETLAPPFGLVWQATTKIGPLPFWILDTHFEGAGRLRGTVLGIPVMRASGTDVSRSSRHRVVAESLWIPPVLLPHRGVVWTAETDETIRARLVVDDEPIDVRLTLHPDGAVRELFMQRYGNVGTPDWAHIPYGYAVEAESVFGGYTIASKVRGGWWYGTDRYNPEGASVFNIQDARYV